jgi:murein DD-endopeptidase MepM/ murein hydrolase activator NlpD
MRWGPLHAGIDVAVPAGTPIYAAATGRVTTKGWVGGYGNYTCLDHGRRISTCYAHQSRFGPTPSGGILAGGQLVGYVGCTGHCFGPHVHFEVGIAGRPVDPCRTCREGADMTRLRILLASLAALAVLVGCEDPYAQRSTDPASGAEVERARQQQARGDELAPVRPERDRAPDEPVGRVAATARAALERFCAQWANWSWRTIDRQQARLARLATRGASPPVRA